MRVRAVRLLWILAAAALALLLFKVFVADVYRINSGSMRPTLFGGSAHSGSDAFSEWVLVLYDRAPKLERFDLAVHEPREGDDAVVKRVVGLPGETISLSQGDLLVEGKRLGPQVARPAPIPVFDDRFQDLEEFFHYERGEGLWRREAGVWALNGANIAAGKSEGMMFFHPGLKDGYLDQDGKRITGLLEVNDAVLECEFALDEANAAARLRFQLVEHEDTFELRILAKESGEEVELVRRNASSLQRSDPLEREIVIASLRLRLERGRFYELRFSNVDNIVTAELPELGACLRTRYDENEPGAVPNGHRGPRAAFGGEGLQARFRSIRILRDLYYTRSGTFGTDAPIALGPDEIFMLGDNSAWSQDSRHYGPVHVSEVAGRPVAVVWPPARMRWL